MILKLGDYRLSPRPSIAILDEEENVNLRSDANSADSNCPTDSDTCQSPIETKEIVFKVRFIGNGDLAAATKMYNAFQTYLATICSSNILEYYRQVHSEEPDVYDISKAYMRRIDMDWEYDCYGVRSGEVHLTTATVDETTSIVSGTYTVTVPAS